MAFPRSSTSSLCSTQAYPNNHNASPYSRQLLETHITLYTLSSIAALILLMLLIWHTSTTYLVEKFDMPSIWEREFKAQQLGGVRVWVWAVVFGFVPIDLLHALVCLGRWHGRIGERKTRDRERRKAVGIRVNWVLRRIIRWVRRRFWRFESGSSGPANNTPTTTRDVRKQSSWISTTTEPSSISIDSASDPPLAYHPFFSSRLTQNEQLTLLTLWDTLAILILAIHISSFFTNLAPSIAFCSTPATLAYPDWAFHDSSIPEDWKLGPLDRKAQLPLQGRCERINWAIWCAGGFSSAGAAILAGLHVFAMCMRGWELWWGMRERRSERKRKRIVTEEEEQNWEHPPRDVDVRTRFRRSLERRSSEPARKVSEEVSEEEGGTGVRQRIRDIGMSGSGGGGSQQAGGRKSDAGWGREAFLECLVP